MKQWILIFLMIGLLVMIGALHRAGLNLIEEEPAPVSSLRMKKVMIAIAEPVWPATYSTGAF